MNRTIRIPLASCHRIHQRCRADEGRRQDDERSAFDFDAWDAEQRWNGHSEKQMLFSVLAIIGCAGLTFWGTIILAVYGAIKACETIFR